MLAITERELRIAARAPKTYQWRLRLAGIATLAFALVIWTARHNFSGRDVFEILTFLAAVYCCCAGLGLTAHALSEERRAGTLGLLFLTELRAHQIVLGNLISAVIRSVYGLLAIVPILSIPLLLGGVPVDHFLRTLAALGNALFLSLAVCLFVSSGSKSYLQSVGISFALLFFFNAGLLILAELFQGFGYHVDQTNWLKSLCPVHALEEAQSGRPFPGTPGFWQTSLNVHITAWAFLLLGSLNLSCSWQDKPKTFSGRLSLRGLWKRLLDGSEMTRKSFRQQLLNYNPILWLSSRSRIACLPIMVVFLLVALAANYVIAPAFFPPFRAQNYFFPAYLIAWVLATSALHAIVVFALATKASLPFGEYQRNGSLELLLVSPLNVRKILSGHLQGLLRRFGPACLTLLLLHALLAWAFLTISKLENPRLMDAWPLFLKIISQGPSTGTPEYRDAYLAFWFLTALSCAFIFQWVALSLVGIWLGLTKRGLLAAPWQTLVLCLLPPNLLTLGTMLLASLSRVFWEWHHLVWFGIWYGLFLNAVWCLSLSGVFVTKLLRQFRERSANPYSPPVKIPYARWVLRTACVALAIGALLAAYYQYENRRWEKQWNLLSRSNKGALLDFKTLIPPEVSKENNFAAHPLFAELCAVLSDNSRQSTARDHNLKNLNLHGGMRGATPDDFFDLTAWQAFYSNRPAAFPAGNLTGIPAEDVLRRLSTFDRDLASVREAASRDAARFPINYDLFPARRLVHHRVLENIVSILELRAVCLLELNKAERATAELILALRVANSVAQEPFASSFMARSQMLEGIYRVLVRGLEQRKFSAEQLRNLEKELRPINLFERYDAVAKERVLSMLAFWDYLFTQPLDEDILRERLLLALAPRGWYYRNKIRLYEFYQGKLMTIVDLPKQTLSAERVASLRQDLINHGGSAHASPDSRMFQSFFEALHRTQSYIDLLRLACALEEYRLLNGVLPTQLHDLKTLEVPKDRATGSAPGYRSISGTNFVIWVTGKDGKNDGGSAELDWVITIPPKNAKVMP